MEMAAALTIKGRSGRIRRQCLVNNAVPSWKRDQPILEFEKKQASACFDERNRAASRY
jgi:hypothetical protein